MEKFKIVSKGYDIEEVNELIDMMIERIEKLSREKLEALKEIERLKKTKSTGVDTRLQDALLAVQETADRMKELARTESKMIIDDAKKNANLIVNEALLNAEKTEYEANLLRKNISVYKNRIRTILESQLELLEDLDKEEL